VIAPAWAPDAAFTRITEALADGGRRVTGNGRQRYCQCPGPLHAHDDRRPSLSVTEGESRVLIRCHAGCDTDDILAALGLARADLFDEPRQRSPGGGWTPWRERCSCQPIARYPYLDENGVLLFEVVRGEHKEFSQRRPDPESRSGWRWSLTGVRRVLYRLPEVLAAPAAACIWIAEGEADVHELERAGEIATTNPGGTGGGWRPEYTPALKDRDVLVVADRDEKGRAHAATVAAAVEEVARSCWIVEAASGKDARDHLLGGHTVHEFVWWAR
jgi:hypothetical protein